MSNAKLNKAETAPSPAGAPKIGQGSTPAAATSTTIKNPAKVGSTSVKMPKAAKQPDAFGKPSLFFKKEEFVGLKRTSIEKLRTFLEKTRSKK